MMSIIERIMPWTPVLFGLIIFAPMFAAVLNELGVTVHNDIPNIVAAMIIGVVWGFIAKYKRRWL